MFADGVGLGEVGGVEGGVAEDWRGDVVYYEEGGDGDGGGGKVEGEEVIRSPGLNAMYHRLCM